MRYFQHANGLFPNAPEKALQEFLDQGGKPYVLKFDGDTFFTVDSDGESLSPYQDIVGCQTYVERGIWVEIPENPFEKNCLTTPKGVLYSGMKKLVKDYPSDIIFLEDATVQQFFGVQLGKSKGFITKHGDNFKAMCSDELTDGDHWPHFASPSLNKTLEKLFDSVVGWEVFVFDTPQELFKWLSE